LVDNPNERYEVLEYLDNHRDAYENSGNTVLLAWANKAIDCWYKNKEILGQNSDFRYFPEVGDDFPKFDFSIDYQFVKFESDPVIKIEWD
jgi:hypothetical protein